MAVNRIGNSAGAKDGITDRDVFADTKGFVFDETIANGKDVAGDEDHGIADSGQDALTAAQCLADGFGLAE